MVTIAFLLPIFVICVAMLWNEGMWGNAITAVNVTLAVLIAVNYFEPLAALLDKAQPDYTYLWDFLMLWALFAVTFGIMRTVTDLLSRYRVRFKMPVEHSGRVFFALWVGWVMVGFTSLSLHLSPLSPHPFGGSFQKTPKSGNFLGMAPGRSWLAFVQKSSRGALSRGHSQGNVPGYERLDEDIEKGRRVFDPRSDFIVKYRNRRLYFDQGRKMLEGGSGPMMLRVRRGEATPPPGSPTAGRVPESITNTEASGVARADHVLP